MTRTIDLSGCSLFLGPLQETLPAWLSARSYSQLFVLADPNTHRHCLPRLALPGAVAFAAGAGETYAPDEAGDMERIKVLATCEHIWAAMLSAQLDRQALVVNLGGGVIGDMGGFCAATFKRGIDFIQVPTSLLAMTDAAIGGKLGIDFQGVKNTIGVFRNPAAVFVDPAFLQTLPARELRSGFAEVIKHALIGDMALWETIRQLPDPLFNLQPEYPGNLLSPRQWMDLLEASIAVKVRIVAADPHERGLRALLNFGHTFGHAVESFFLQTAAPLTHGEAIAIGMICELPPPGWTGLDEPAATPPDFRGDTRVAPTLLRLFGHTPIPETAFPQIWEYMLQDKKNASGTVRIAVPEAEPFAMVLRNITRDEVEKRLRYYNRLALNP